MGTDQSGCPRSCLWSGSLYPVENQRSGRIRALLNSGQETVHVVQAFRSLNLRPASGSMIA